MSRSVQLQLPPPQDVSGSPMDFLICSSPETLILGPYKFALEVGVFYLFIAAIRQQ